MPGWKCSAPNCSKKKTKDARLLRFPKDPDPERRKRWVQNCRWENWTPTDNSRICDTLYSKSLYTLAILSERVRFVQLFATTKSPLLLKWCSSHNKFTILSNQK